LYETPESSLDNLAHEKVFFKFFSKKTLKQGKQRKEEEKSMRREERRLEGGI